MFRFAYANQNNAAASAMCAEAASSCASQSSRFNCIALGAMIMASIIISRLISIIGISLLVMVPPGMAEPLFCMINLFII